MIDLFEEVRGLEMHERLASNERGRFTPDELLAAATVDGYRSLGWQDAGLIADGAAADFVVVRTDTVNTAGCQGGPDPLLRNAIRRRHGRRAAAGWWCEAGRHRLGDVAALLGKAPSDVRDHHEAVPADAAPSSPASASSSPVTARRPTGSACATTPRVVVEDGRHRVARPGGAGARRRPPVDVGGRAVLPGFVDSHAHLVFAGDRGAEFAARMAGTPYDGGGIGVSVAATRAPTDDELRAPGRRRVAEMRAQGTTTVEIKSGYGLTVEDEARGAADRPRVHRRDDLPGRPRRAARVRRRPRGIPRARDRADAGRGAPYARWVDVFCEPHSAHAFTEDEARTVLLAGREAGLELRVHGNQLGHGPGVQLAVELGAASVDHCTYLSEADVEALAGAADTTVATLLPGVEFSTRSPYPDAAALLAGRASRSRWRPTATRAPATRRRCRS